MDRGESFALDAAREAAIKVATLAEVNAAFRKYIKPDEWLIGVAGDFAKAASQTAPK
jgi:zinc protease